MGPSVERVLTICWNGFGTLNKMATMPIYEKKKKKKKEEKKHLKIFFCRTEKGLGLNLGLMYRGLKVYQVCSNDDCRLTFDLITARSDLCPFSFVWGNIEKVVFSKCIKD